nr:hypothetical protein [Novispirillum itersonii]
MLLFHPFMPWVQYGLTLARVWVAHEPLTVPDQHSTIQLVMEYAIPACAVAVNRAGVPKAASRCRYAIVVQALGDFSRGSAGNIFGEDPPDDIRFCRIDLSLPEDELPG